MQPCELAAFVTSVACTMAKCLSDEELAVMGAVFNQLGDTLETILTQKEICHIKCEKIAEEKHCGL